LGDAKGRKLRSVKASIATIQGAKDVIAGETTTTTTTGDWGLILDLIFNSVIRRIQQVVFNRLVKQVSLTILAVTLPRLRFIALRLITQHN
jgi:hypothetical protein